MKSFSRNALLLSGTMVAGAITAIALAPERAYTSDAEATPALSSAVDFDAFMQQTDSVMAPKFEVDPEFPKPLPKGWVLGMSVGVAVDAQDHVWIVHRPPTISANERGADQSPPYSECCTSAPPIIEFDQQGNVLRNWGGPVTTGQYEWPESNHGLSVDKNTIWIGANAANDSHILHFTLDGKFIAQFGKSGKGTGSKDSVNFGAPAKVVVDPKTNEAYVADGYRNKRVAVIDATTGKIKRFWSAYGNAPTDSSLGTYVPGEDPKKTIRGPVHWHSRPTMVSCTCATVRAIACRCSRMTDHS
jgi:hypothetical protein